MPLSVLRGTRLPGDRWTRHDSSLAAALTLHEASLCSGCGHSLLESASPSADPNAGDRTHHYEAPLPVRCHACTAISLRTEQYDGDEVSAPRALRFHATRIDDTEEGP